MVAGVAAAVHALGRLERVERVADGPVADRVHVHLEAVRVEEDDRLLELLCREHRDPVVVGVDVRLEQGAGEVLQNAVGKDLRAADAQASEGAGGAQLQELVDLLPAAIPVPEEVALDPHGQLAPLGDGAVAGQRHGAVDARVLPRGDAQRVERLLCPEDAGLPLLGGRLREEAPDEVLRLLVQRPLRLAGGVALDPATRGIRGLAGDAGELERPAVDPGAVAVAVLEERRPVGEDRVEVGSARRSPLEGVDRPARALDPRELRVLGRVAGDRLQACLPAVGVVEDALQQLDAALGRMAVGVLEAGKHRAALELEDAGGRPDVGAGLARGPHPGDPAVLDGDGLGDGQRGVGREHSSSGEDEVRGLRHALMHAAS